MNEGTRLFASSISERRQGTNSRQPKGMIFTSTALLKAMTDTTRQHHTSNTLLGQNPLMATSTGVIDMRQFLVHTRSPPSYRE